MEQTIACSVILCEDILGGNTKYQEDIISDEKFNAQYEETHVLLGHKPDSRAMAVLLLPRCREKLIAVIQEGRWFDTRESATIVEIAQINGLLANAGEYFLWVQAQLFNIQELLREEIKEGYRCKWIKARTRKECKTITVGMPSDMSYRLRFLEEKYMAKFLWKKKTQILITKAIRQSIKTIHLYLMEKEYWSTPIGHIVPRTPYCKSFGDASHYTIGLLIPA